MRRLKYFAAISAFWLVLDVVFNGAVDVATINMIIGLLAGVICLPRG